MSDSFFIDTNILVYASLKDSSVKHDRAVSFIAGLACKITTSSFPSAFIGNPVW